MKKIVFAVLMVAGFAMADEDRMDGLSPIQIPNDSLVTEWKIPERKVEVKLDLGSAIATRETDGYSARMDRPDDILMEAKW